MELRRLAVLRQVRRDRDVVAFAKIFDGEPCGAISRSLSSLTTVVAQHEEGMIRRCADDPATGADLEDLLLAGACRADDLGDHDLLRQLIEREDALAADKLLDLTHAVG